MVHLVFIGNTGSGKSTLARRVADDLDVPYIGSGVIARRLSEHDATTDLALRQGAMAPEAAMRHEVRVQIESADVQRGGWVLDGFPRTVAQLIALMTWSSAPPTFLLMNVSEWTCVDRLMKRARPDDNPDAIERKLAGFRTLTAPMIDLLDSGKVLSSVPDMSTEHQIDYVKGLLR